MFHEFSENTHFMTGAIGEPGKRMFYIQFGDPTQSVSVKVEKQQVAALAQFLKNVLDDLPAPEDETSTPAPQETVEPEWTAGEIAVGVDQTNQKILVRIEEAKPIPNEEEDDDSETFARAKVLITPLQAKDFIDITSALLAQSRPPCRICGQPMNPEGHNCPRLN